MRRNKRRPELQRKPGWLKRKKKKQGLPKKLE